MAASSEFSQRKLRRARRTACCWLAGWLLTAVAASARAGDAMSLADYMALTGPAPNTRISYGTAPSQYIEVYLPAGSAAPGSASDPASVQTSVQASIPASGPASGPPAALPVVVLIHGGCWSKDLGGISQMHELAGTLRDAGFVVWNVEYRRIDEEGGGYPGTYVDVAAAIDALAAHASSYHLDTSRVVVVGHSAGAYLGRWLAGRARLPRNSPLYQAQFLPVREVIGLGSVGGDLRVEAGRLERTCDVSVEGLAGHPGPGRVDVLSDTSPIELTPNDSRQVLIDAAGDRISEPAEIMAEARAAARRGQSIEVEIVPEGGHFDEVSTRWSGWPLVLHHIREATATSN